MLEAVKKTESYLAVSAKTLVVCSLSSALPPNRSIRVYRTAWDINTDTQISENVYIGTAEAVSPLSYQKLDSGLDPYDYPPDGVGLTYSAKIVDVYGNEVTASNEFSVIANLEGYSVVPQQELWIAEDVNNPIPLKQFTKSGSLSGPRAALAVFLVDTERTAEGHLVDWSPLFGSLDSDWSASLTNCGPLEPYLDEAYPTNLFSIVPGSGSAEATFVYTKSILSTPGLSTLTFTLQIDAAQSGGDFVSPITWAYTLEYS
jgi:hypothetical protein